MHKLKSIQQFTMDRNVILQNIETKTEDKCFDYCDNFDFMRVGEVYDCRIKLFGDTRSDNGGKKVLCRVLRDDVFCGNAHHVEVKVGEDIYYVSRKDVDDQLSLGSFFFYFTRKDLVMVNGFVNELYLLPI